MDKQQNPQSFLNDNTRPLNTEEARNYLGLSKDHFYRLTSQRKLPAYRPNGKKLYFYKEELDEWVRRNRITPEYELQEKAIKNVMIGRND